ncbi:MAG: ribonuclease HII [Bacilli bacterium]
MKINEIKHSLQQEDFTREQLESWRKDERAGVKKLIASYDRQQQQVLALEEKAEEMLQYERIFWANGAEFVAGVDEVGRGPLAGPVVSCAVVLPKETKILGLDDSKKLSLAKRQQLFEEIHDVALSIGISILGPEVIDEYNIYESTKRAMYDALSKLETGYDALLVDAMPLKVDVPSESIIKGDQKSASIAAASVIAKVTRDELMKEMHEKYPHYDFQNNSGYGTKKHLEGLASHGICPIHRKSFEPVATMVRNQT